MLDIIKNLLILQDRDQKIQRLQSELANFGPQRQQLEHKGAATQGHYADIKQKLMTLEKDRKDAEVQVDQKKAQIAKYSLQQFQTKKNEEYRALAHEIETCQANIRQLEDRQLELMEQTETTQKEAAAAHEEALAVQKVVAAQLAEIAAREQVEIKALAELKANREALASAVEEGARSRYERSFKNKDGRVLAGIEHGACGGCHVKLPPQIILMCKQDLELVGCPNCSRILYYTLDMDMEQP